MSCVTSHSWLPVLCKAKSKCFSLIQRPSIIWRVFPIPQNLSNHSTHHSLCSSPPPWHHLLIPLCPSHAVSQGQNTLSDYVPYLTVLFSSNMIPSSHICLKVDVLFIFQDSIPMSLAPHSHNTASLAMLKHLCWYSFLCGGDGVVAQRLWTQTPSRRESSFTTDSLCRVQ